MAHRALAAAVLAATIAAVALAPAPRSEGGAARAAVAAAKDPADALMKKMLAALKSHRFDDYVADGTDNLKALSKPSFTLVSAHFGPLLDKGYKTTYLATLAKPDDTIHLWKLVTQGSAEEFLVRVVLRNGKVDSFSLT
jgi:hypothetical protein